MAAQYSSPYFPLAGMSEDGYSKEDEATATCFCGAVQLAFVSLLLTLHAGTITQKTGQSAPYPLLFPSNSSTSVLTSQPIGNKKGS